MIGLTCIQRAVGRSANVLFLRSYSVKRLGASNYPERLPSIDETAQRLGFENALEMYPEYPVDEPPELWLITQMQKLKFRPHWEKEIMKEMGLYKIHDFSVQMNSNGVNEKLWQVKHLIKIQPIRFPQGYPTEEDIGGTHLKKNGEFIIFKKLENGSDVDADSLTPQLNISKWKVVDGYRKCNNCTSRRCYRLNMCQKLWLQRGQNTLERLGPRMFNFVEPETDSTGSCSETQKKTD